MAYNSSQGRTNPAFSKPCLFLSDTRHFRHFRRFQGSEGAKPLFSVGRVQIRHFRHFRQNGPFLAGDKNTVYQKHGLCDPEIGSFCLLLSLFAYNFVWELFTYKWNFSFTSRALLLAILAF